MEKLNLSYNGHSDTAFDPVEFTRMKIETLNKQPGALTGYDCPKCLNKGYVAIQKEDGGMAVRDCDCMTIRRCVWEMEKSGLENIIRDKTFQSFAADEEWQKVIKTVAMTYADKPEGWLLFCGQSGSGKTHLCTAVCRQRLLQGDVVRYMPWRDKVAELKALSLDSDRRAEIINGYKTAQILYIDDLYKVGRAADGSSNPTAADIGLAFEIFNYRYMNHLPTIISTEKTPDELVEIDEAIGSRIIEMTRCNETEDANVCLIARDSKRNYRLRGMVAV